MAALDDLIAAVEAGTATGGDGAVAVPLDKSDLIEAALGDDDDVWSDFCSAHDGDLNSALLLHNALIPEWHFTLALEANRNGYIANVSDKTWDNCNFADASTPARAWLLAILRAYRATTTSSG